MHEGGVSVGRQDHRLKWAWLTVLLVTLVAGVWRDAAAGPIEITKLRFGQDGGKARIVFDMQGTPKFYTAVSPDGLTLSVGLTGIAWRPPTSGAIRHSDLLLRYLFRPEPKLSNGRLDIHAQRAIHVASAVILPPTGGVRFYRLVIDLVPLDEPAKPGPTAVVKPPPPPERPQSVAPQSMAPQSMAPQSLAELPAPDRKPATPEAPAVIASEEPGTANPPGAAPSKAPPPPEAPPPPDAAPAPEGATAPPPQKAPVVSPPAPPATVAPPEPAAAPPPPQPAAAPPPAAPPVQPAAESPPATVPAPAAPPTQTAALAPPPATPSDQAAWTTDEIDRDLADATKAIVGHGDSPDYRTALRLFERAAAAGSPIAAFNAGELYRAGKGVPVDLPAAATWYDRSARAGFAPAQFYLGVLLYNGIGVAPDRERAHQLLAAAAGQGHAQAKAALAEIEKQSAAAQSAAGAPAKPAEGK